MAYFYTGKNEDGRHGEIRGHIKNKKWKWQAEDVAQMHAKATMQSRPGSLGRDEKIGKAQKMQGITHF